MIYLEFLEGQGLGNQLWNYVTLRSLSKVLNLDYKIVNPEKFKGKDFLDISHSSLNNSKIKNHDCDIKHIFNEKLFYDNELKTFVSDFDNKILTINSHTIIRGLFQSEKYLFNNDINEFIKLKPNSKRYLKGNKNQCLLNIRGGEYKRFSKLILPKSYWLNAIENMKSFKSNLSFSIITDDYDYVSKLLPEIKIIKGQIQDDFYQIFHADYLIVSNSSFSYFPINLGRKPKKVIAPLHWARFGNPENKWISPANYYKDWAYQNKYGEIINTKIIKESIKKTKSIYATYNVLTTTESFSRRNVFSLFPKRYKKVIKNLLSKIFPLFIG